MYYNGQIIWDYQKQEPVQIKNVWDVNCYPKRHTHFIEHAGDGHNNLTFMRLARPKTVLEAWELLKKGLISPSPLPPTHCWKCGNWKSNHSKDGSCWR